MAALMTTIATTKPIDNILKEFISNGERTIRLAELQSRLMITSTPINFIELNKTALRLKSLFNFTHIATDLAITVDIRLKACSSYNSPRGCPLDPLECPHLHICEKKLKSTSGCKGSCRLNHLFNIDEIKQKLIEDRFDYNTLMKFYQTFYVPNTSSTVSASAATAAYDSDNESVRSNEDSCPIEHRRVMVKFSEEFVRLHNQKFLFDLFARRDKTGGGYIEKFEWKPKEQHAIITYQKKSTAERLLKKRDIRWEKFIFTVAKTDEKQSTSDYKSSKNRPPTETSTSTSVLQTSSKNPSSNNNHSGNQSSQMNTSNELYRQLREYKLREDNNKNNNDDNDSVLSNEDDSSPELRQVKVKLPDDFVRQHNQKYLFDLFARREKTGGGYIDHFEYKPNEQCAVILFKKKSTADRLLKRRDINSQGFLFVVTRPDEKPFVSEYNPSKGSANNNNSSSGSSSNNKGLNNKFYLVSTEHNASKDKATIEKYAMILAKTKPASVELIHEPTGRWLIEMPENKTFEFNEMQRLKDIMGDRFPQSLKLEQVSKRNRQQRNRTDSQQVNEESELGAVGKVPRGKKLTADQLERYKYRKPLEKNVFLSMILKSKNEMWRNELQTLLKRERATMEIDPNELVIMPVGSEMAATLEPVNDWFARLNRLLSEYFARFRMEKIKREWSNHPQLEELKQRIDEYQKLEYEETDDDMIAVIGRLDHFADFLSRQPQFRSLFARQPLITKQMSVTSSQAKPTEEENENITSRNVRLPTVVYKLHTALIDRLVRYMKVKFELKLCFVDEENSNVDFMGSLVNASRAAQIFAMCVSTENSHIRTRPISNFNLNILKAKQLDEILQDALKNVELVFDVRVGKFEQREEPGIFVSYFHNIAEIDSVEDTVYDRIQFAITSTLDYDEIDITAHLHLLRKPEWIAFQEENLSEKIARNNFEIIINPIVNKRVIMSLIGKKTFLWQVKTRIEEFIAQNNPPGHVIKLDRDNINFLQNVVRNDLQALETLYDIKFRYENLNLIIDNCPEKIVKQIESKIDLLISSKSSKTCDMGAIPGTQTIVQDSQFVVDLKKLESELETVIIPEVRKKQPMQSSNSQLRLEAEAANIENQTEKTGNETNMSVSVNNSIINLQTGNIIKSKVDGIVNLISSQPETNQGVLARAVFQAAGPSVLNEVMSNGDGQDLVVTTAGDLKQVRCILHCRLTNFVSIVQASRDIKALVKNCLDTAIVYDLHSIAFPTIGLGKQNYPLAHVASLMISAVSEFLAKNKNVPLTVCIIVFENDGPKFLQTFRNELVKIEQKNLPKKDEILNIPNENLFVKLVSTSPTKCELAATRIKNLLNQKYVKRETIQRDMTSLLDDSQLLQIVTALAHELPDCQLTLRTSNQSIEIYGTTNRVLEAKSKLHEQIAKANTDRMSRLEQNLRVAKDFQWQYKVTPNNVWKNFPVYLNSLIETDYRLRKGSVKFSNEENEEAVVFLNVNPMIYTYSNKTYELRRVNVTTIPDLMGPGSLIPSNWSPMSDDVDILLIDIGSSTPEYNSVLNDFTQKLGRSVKTFKLQRVQNLTLYRQYAAHKEKFVKERRADNEKNLFHGSDMNSLMKICRFGFDRSYCGKNGTAYGQGVYFAVNSQYSDRYAQNTSTGGGGLKCMIRAKVLVGETCQGNSSMRTPPERPNGQGPYDSTCDSHGTIFVCYRDSQCYPEYLIQYV